MAALREQLAAAAAWNEKMSTIDTSIEGALSNDEESTPSPSETTSLASLSSHLDSESGDDDDDVDRPLSSSEWLKRQPTIDDPTLPPDDTTPRTLAAWREKHFPVHPPSLEE